jgi:hypothetical protein
VKKPSHRPKSATILASSAGHYTVAVWGDVGIVHWMRQADGPAMQRVHELFKAVVEQHPRGVSFVHLVDDGAGLPDPDARRVLTEMMEGFAEGTVCVAVVLMGAGFWASALQSLLTGMRLLAPPRPWTMRFASHPRELRKWLPGLHEQRTQHAILADELEGAIHVVVSAGASQPAGRELH